MTSLREWTVEDDLFLREGVLRYGLRWDQVAAYLDHKRSAEACRLRWEVTKYENVKGSWVPEEDRLLCRLVNMYGDKAWTYVARRFPGRSGKQCRERWVSHHLANGGESRKTWTKEEDQVLLNAREKVGNRWSLIAKLLPGRSETHVKQRFNSIVTRIWRNATTIVSENDRGAPRSDLPDDVFVGVRSNKITPRPSLDDGRHSGQSFSSSSSSANFFYDYCDSRHRQNDLFRRVEFSQSEWDHLEAKAARKAVDAPYEAATLAATATAVLAHAHPPTRQHAYSRTTDGPPLSLPHTSPPTDMRKTLDDPPTSTSMESIEWNLFCDDLSASPTTRFPVLSGDEMDDHDDDNALLALK